MSFREVPMMGFRGGVHVEVPRGFRGAYPGITCGIYLVPGIRLELTWKSHRAPVRVLPGIGFSGASVGLPWCLRASLLASAVLPREPHGEAAVLPWYVHGISVD